MAAPTSINNPALTPPFCALLNHVINRFDTLQSRSATRLNLPAVDEEKQRLVVPFITGEILSDETKVQIVR